MSVMAKRVVHVVTMFFLAGAFAQGGELPLVKFSIVDGEYRPDTAVVQAGMPVRLEISNQGTNTQRFDSPALREHRLITPGEVVTIDVVAPSQPGDYEFANRLGSREIAGKLIVQ